MPGIPRTAIALLLAVSLTVCLAAPADAGLVRGDDAFSPDRDAAFLAGFSLFLLNSFIGPGPISVDSTAVSGTVSADATKTSVDASSFQQRLGSTVGNRAAPDLAASGDYARTLQDEAWRDDGAAESSTTERDYRTVSNWLER